MNLQQMQQLRVLAETLNFRRAAERLHMEQPPLSVSIRRLEKELGGELFVRDRRNVRLTALGEAVLAHARQIAFHAEQLRRVAAEAGQGLGGSLRIGFVGSATYHLLPHGLPVFRTRFPGVTLELREGTTTQLLQQVDRGDIDIGLVRYPVIETTRARVHPIEHDQLVAALPAHDPLARKRVLRLADLRDAPFVLYSAQAASNLRAQVIAACHAAGFIPNVAQEAVQVQTLLSLVGSGAGVAVVPSISQAHRIAGIAFRPLADAARGQLDVAIAAAVHATSVPAAAQRFIEVLREQARADTPGRPAIPPTRHRRGQADPSPPSTPTNREDPAG